ncbi:hypothetical protein BU24DRAFT_422031 [Aaosphaeria arxii CBS 175.79]|uniref:Uncharacterized protein n=1 Tax=Aaosphaeria arxii CBS 175.79 TaxID=1450172 RepID=A0A6A5XS32_9PLEO|nr:uncharacterized protein BU24DRAFT_422031 [Aaosphaeria arxii CBS 175.79]KAF2015719.1 hypothetical protein BU24DRAFT_422031 [Aaosphaeria arxii CBS 175.79]
MREARKFRVPVSTVHPLLAMSDSQAHHLVTYTAIFNVLYELMAGRRLRADRIGWRSRPVNRSLQRHLSRRPMAVSRVRSA